MGMGMAFSALHLAAWNWDFPSTPELYLWRGAALGATTVCVPVGLLLPLMGSGMHRWQRVVISTLIYPAVGVYILCRATLVIQTFLCFRSMPASVYQSVNWIYYIPNVS